MNQLKEPVYQESYDDNPQNDTTKDPFDIASLLCGFLHYVLPN